MSRSRRPPRPDRSPNQLLDQRDEAIDQLSQYVNVNTLSESNGAMDVYIGSGQPLVLGGTAQKLTTIPNAYDPSQQDIGIVTGGGCAPTSPRRFSGGSLGGLLERTQPGARSDPECPRA